MFKELLSMVGAVGLLLLASPANAQQAAVPPVIRMVMPFATGSTTDLIARTLASQLSSRLGTTVIVDVRGGGSTMIGSGAVANGPKDGSVLLITTNSTVTAAATLKSVPFDMNRDLIPLAVIGDGPMIVGASAKSSIKTPADLIAAARANPDGITHGTSGVGSLPHLSVELFSLASKVQLKHIPYKGGGAAVVDLASGTIDIMFATHSTFAPHVQSGRVNLIGVTTEKPFPTYPNLPTMATVAPGFAGSVWVAVFAPSGIPSTLAQRLNRELNDISAAKEMHNLLVTNGLPPLAMGLDELRIRMQAEYANWKKIASSKNISLE